MAITTTTAFGFLSTDIKTQFNLAEKIGRDVEQMRAQISELRKSGQNEVANQLETTANNLVRIGTELAANATVTSSMATSVISAVTAKSS